MTYKHKYAKHILKWPQTVDYKHKSHLFMMRKQQKIIKWSNHEIIGSLTFSLRNERNTLDLSNHHIIDHSSDEIIDKSRIKTTKHTKLRKLDFQVIFMVKIKENA